MGRAVSLLQGVGIEWVGEICADGVMESELAEPDRPERAERQALVGIGGGWRGVRSEKSSGVGVLGKDRQPAVFQCLAGWGVGGR